MDYFQSLSEQFDTQVVVVRFASSVSPFLWSERILQSTFTASLIVSWLSFVQTIVPTSHETAFNIGMFISFLALGFHFGNIEPGFLSAYVVPILAGDRVGVAKSVDR